MATEEELQRYTRYLIDCGYEKNMAEELAPLDLSGDSLPVAYLIWEMQEPFREAARQVASQLIKWADTLSHALTNKCH